MDNVENTVFLTFIEDILEKKLSKDTYILDYKPIKLEEPKTTSFWKPHPEAELAVEKTNPEEGVVEIEEPDVIPLAATRSPWFTMPEGKYERMKIAEDFGEILSNVLTQVHKMSEEARDMKLRLVRTRCELEPTPPPKDRHPDVTYLSNNGYRVTLKTAFEIR